MGDIANQLAQRIARASVSGERLRLRGAGSKPWHKSSPGIDTLGLSEHRGILDYEPTELVITARAGTPLSELDAALAERGQMLAAECPDFGGRSTLGGALALGWSGARRPYAGSLRDFVLGLRMINGLGETLRFGGRVMKNVAGYDISRLMSGSGGRLGAILDVSLKVLPLPEHEAGVAIEAESLAQALTLLRELRGGGKPVSAATFGGGVLRIRFSGGEKTVVQLLRSLGGESLTPDYWDTLRRLELPIFRDGAGRLWRLTLSPRADLSALQGEMLVDWGGELAWYRGVESAAELEALLGEGSAVALDEGPREATGSLGALHSRIAAAFDPVGVFGGEPAGAP